MLIDHISIKFIFHINLDIDRKKLLQVVCWFLGSKSEKRDRNSCAPVPLCYFTRKNVKFLNFDWTTHYDPPQWYSFTFPSFVRWTVWVMWNSWVILYFGSQYVVLCYQCYRINLSCCFLNLFFTFCDFIGILEISSERFNVSWV